MATKNWLVLLKNSKCFFNLRSIVFLLLKQIPTELNCRDLIKPKIMKKVYIASPLGFSECGRSFYPSLINLVNDCGLSPIDPWTITPQAKDYKLFEMLQPSKLKNDNLKRLNMICALNNAKAIEQCDILLAVLDGTDIDSGTASEIGYAAALNKNIIGYKGDSRKTGDNDGAIVNLQVQYFLEKTGNKIVFSMEELTQSLFTLK